jgi:hypothetical protein
MSNQTYIDYTTPYYYGTGIIVPIGLALNLLQFIIFMNKDFEKDNFGFL